MKKPDSLWNLVPIFFFPLPVLLFYWLFESENPIENVFNDNYVFFSYVFLGIGSIIYLVLWIGMLIKYSSFKTETWDGWYGSSKVFSVSGVFLTFFFCHTFGIFILLWCIWAFLKKIYECLFGYK